MKQDYAKKDKKLKPMATLRSETLPDNILQDAYSNIVCTPESDKRVGESIWCEIRKPVGRID